MQSIVHTAPFVLKAAPGIRVSSSSSRDHERCRWSENKRTGRKGNGYSPDVQFNSGSIWTKRCLCNVIKWLQQRAPTTTHRHPLSETQMFIKLLPRRGPRHICQTEVQRPRGLFAQRRAEHAPSPSRVHSWRRGVTVGSGGSFFFFQWEIEVRNLCFTGSVLTFKPGLTQAILWNNFPSSVTWVVVGEVGGKKKRMQKFKGQTCF